MTTFQTIEKIMTDLEVAFKEVDEKIVEQSKEWLQERRAAVREFKASDEGRAMMRNQHAYYGRVFELAGGKTYYTMFNGRPLDEAFELIERNCKATAARRNAKIATKLEKLEVTEASEIVFAPVDAMGSFTGTFCVNTNRGEKKIIIENILAGGYNIQRLHMRTLVKVTK